MIHCNLQIPTLHIKLKTMLSKDSDSYFDNEAKIIFDTNLANFNVSVVKKLHLVKNTTV